jgi:CspA family cold shock protein
MTTAAAQPASPVPASTTAAQPAAAGPRISGHVKWYDAKKGFGFIVRTGEKDVFIHSSDLRKSGVENDLAEGEPVSFELAQSGKGPKAVNLRRGL